MNNDFEKNQQNSYNNDFIEKTNSDKENEPIEATFTESQSSDTSSFIKEDDVSETEKETVSQEKIYNTDTCSFSDGTSYKHGNTNGYEWNPIPPQKKTKKQKKHGNSSGLRVFTSIMLCVFVLSFATLTAMVATYVVDSKNDDKSHNTLTQDTSKYSSVTDPSSYAAITNIPANAQSLTIPQIAAKCSPSAVGILVEVDASYSFGFFTQQGVATSVGSGFIFSKDGYIITNHHVVDNAKSIKVVLHDKTELDATIVGSDSISDIAVIKVTDTDDTTLIPMEIGNSDNLVVGEEVVAIGCPAGIEYMGTVTNGIVSAINRDIEITDNYGRIQKTMTLIQTNATINKGNSGGPLINNRGQVVGINTLKLTSDFEGIGFSIPMNGAMAIINQLIEHGKVIERTEEDFAYGQGQIGISGQAISAEEAEYYGIPEGVLVYQISKESSASKAGLRRGDIITKYNGKEVKTVQDINDLKSKNRAGERVTLTVYRDGDNGKGQTFDISFNLDAAS